MVTDLCVYFLNLDRHKIRFESMSKQLNQINVSWQRFVAVDALEASEEELDEYVDIEGPIPRMGKGARACTVGHFKIWKQFLETGSPVAFILEDDVLISKDFSVFIKEALKYKDKVDILNFNRQNSKGTYKKLVVSTVNPIKSEIFEAKKLLAPHYGTAGYMITREAAQKLINDVQRTNMPIDCLLFSPNVSKVSRDFRVYQTFPAMVEPNVDTFQTSIQTESVPEALSILKKIKRAYYEVNRVPWLLIQILLGRAEIKILNFLK